MRAVFHCYIGDLENARKVIELGGLVSFGGVTTFKNACQALQTALAMKDGEFMLETDSPYLAPMPHRGKRNEPSFVRHTAEFLAAQRGVDFATLAATTTETAKLFFRWRN